MGGSPIPSSFFLTPRQRWSQNHVQDQDIPEFCCCFSFLLLLLLCMIPFTTVAAAAASVADAGEQDQLGLKCSVARFVDFFL